MSLPLHRREQIVTEARLDLQRLVLDWQRDNHEKLTELEELKILNEVLSGTIATQLKFGIRFERHGNYDTPGGEE